MALLLSPGAALELLLQEARKARVPGGWKLSEVPRTGPPDRDSFNDLLANLAETIVLADEMLERLRLLETSRYNYAMYKRLQSTINISRSAAEQQVLELLAEKPQLRLLGYG